MQRSALHRFLLLCLVLSCYSATSVQGEDLAVVSPSASDKWSAGNSAYINWQGPGVTWDSKATATIGLFRDETDWPARLYSIIGVGVPNNGYYTETLETDTPAGVDYYVVVQIVNMDGSLGPKALGPKFEIYGSGSALPYSPESVPQTGPGTCGASLLPSMCDMSDDCAGFMCFLPENVTIFGFTYAEVQLTFGLCPITAKCVMTSQSSLASTDLTVYPAALPVQPAFIAGSNFAFVTRHPAVNNSGLTFDILVGSRPPAITDSAWYAFKPIATGVRIQLPASAPTCEETLTPTPTPTPTPTHTPTSSSASPTPDASEPPVPTRTESESDVTPVTRTADGISRNSKVAIGVAVGGGGALMAAAALAVFISLRMRSPSASATAPSPSSQSPSTATPAQHSGPTRSSRAPASFSANTNVRAPPTVHL